MNYLRSTCKVGRTEIRWVETLASREAIGRDALCRNAIAVRLIGEAVPGFSKKAIPGKSLRWCGALPSVLFYFNTRVRQPSPLGPVRLAGRASGGFRVVYRDMSGGRIWIRVKQFFHCIQTLDQIQFNFD